MSKTIDYTNLNEKSGIYMLINSENNKRYVGSSKNLYDRLHQHFHNLKYNKHHSLHLQASYNKYGESNFEYEICFFHGEKIKSRRLLQKICNLNKIKEPPYLPTNF